MSSKFSAHKTPLEFAEWIITRNGREWYDNLKAKSKKTWNKKYEDVEQYLISETKKLTE